ncbi:MAG: choice-of-anchor Q domain-containing protein [Blastocatellia bacterium]
MSKRTLKKFWFSRQLLIVLLGLMSVALTVVAWRAQAGARPAFGRSAPVAKTVTATKAPAAVAALFAFASTISVTSTGDGTATAANCPGASCRLRDAIAAAAAGDSINFAVSGTITLQSRLFLDKNLTIQGPGANALTISGNDATRLFFVQAGTISLSDLTLANGLGKGGGTDYGGGAAGMGGAIFQNGGALTLTNVTLLSNRAVGGTAQGNSWGGGGGFGGGVTNNNGAGGSDLGGVGGLAGGLAGPIDGGDGGGGGVGIGRIGNSRGGNGGFGGGGGGATDGAAGGLGGFGGGGGSVGNSSLSSGGLGGFGGGVGNHSTGGSTNGGGGAGFGGAIFVRSGSLTLNAVSFGGNQATGGTGFQNGQAKGGALFVYSGATATLTNTSFAGSVAADFGQPGIGNSAAPYTTGATCPGNDTANICGTFSGAALNTLTVNGGGSGTVTGGGLSCAGTCTAQAQGTVTLIATPTNGYTFTGWSGGGCSGTGTCTANLSSGNQTVTANFCTNSTVVTNTNDSGAGSLRQILNDACPGSTITFASNVTGVITLTSGELVIGKNLTIQGPGEQVLSISGNLSSRVFRITNGATASLTGLKIEKGKVDGGNSAEIIWGGGILNEASTLQMSHCIISGNSIGGSSGGNYGGGLATRVGTLIMTDCTLSDNSFNTSLAPVRGGGLASVVSTVSLTNCTLSGNSARNGRNNSEGGGIYTERSTLTLTNTTLSNNFARDTGSNAGGGIYIYSGTANLIGSTLSGNFASTLGNSTLNRGGGVFTACGFDSATTLCIVNSTLSGNSVSGGNLSQGGGIFNANGVSGNTLVEINNSTVVNNAATRGGGIDSQAFNGIPIVTARNTIIAGNTAASPDVNGPLTSRGYNLIGDGTGATLTPTTGDQIGDSNNPLNPRLVTLANNGGLTQTHALDANSPALNKGGDVTTLNGAINASTDMLTLGNAAAFPVGAVLQIDSEQLTVTVVANNTLTVARGANNTAPAAHNDGAAVNPAFDQRGPGFPRKVGSAPDIGAFEVQNNAPTLTLNTTAPSLSQGSQQSGVALGSVDDVESPIGGLQVSLTSANPSNGVTLSQFSNSNGLLSATLQADCLATNASFTLTVMDEAGTVTTAQLNVSVTPNTKPVIGYPNNPGTAFGQGLTINPVAPPTDNGSIQSFQVVSITPALLSGITVSSAGVVTVASTVPANTYAVTIRATDNCNLTQEASFTLGIAKFTPTVTWNYPADIPYGTALGGTQLNATPSVAGSLTYSPALGSVLNAGPQTLGVTFTPSDTVNYSTVTKSVTLNVLKAALGVTVNNAARNQGEANPAFSGTLTGLKNNDAITASYSTTANAASAPGTYPITATLNDPNNRLGNYTVTNMPGTLTIFNSCGITINPATLPAATRGTPFVQTLSASPTGSYVFSMLAGQLPPGISLVNTLGIYSLRGTPTTAGQYTFTIKATKSNSTCESVRTYTIVVP